MTTVTIASAASHWATNSLMMLHDAAEVMEKVMILNSCLDKLFDSLQTKK